MTAVMQLIDVAVRLTYTGGNMSRVHAAMQMLLVLNLGAVLQY